MTLSAVIRQLRQLVLEHPECSEYTVWVDTDHRGLPVTGIVIKNGTIEIRCRLEDLT